MCILYLVIENDRGYGDTILDIFTSENQAKEYIKQSSHYYIQELELSKEKQSELLNYLTKNT
jgi:hypothetical protein